MKNFKKDKMFKNNKMFIIISIFIITILLGITTKAPFSLGGPPVDISYMNETWNGEGSFDSEEMRWYSKWNSQENIIFYIDFKGETHYSSGEYFDVVVTNEDNEEIINFNGVDNSGLNSEKISITPDKENPTTRFQVEVELPDEICKELNFSIKIGENEVSSHGEFSKEFTIKIDNEAPIVDIKDIEDGSIFNIANEENNLEINFIVKEENFQDISISLNISKNGEEAYEVREEELLWEKKLDENQYGSSYSLDEAGVYKIVFTVTDKAGNSGQITKTFQINREGKEIYEIVIEGDSSNNSNKNIIFNGDIFSLEFESIYYKFNGEKVNGIEVNETVVENTSENILNFSRIEIDDRVIGAKFSGEFTTVGKYEIFVKTNNDEETLIGTFIIDKTKPVISFGVLGDGAVYNSEQTSTISVSDEEDNLANLGDEEAFITITKNGVLVKEIDEKLTVLENYLFNEGIYTIKVYGKDEAGNIAEGANEEGYKEISFTVDTTDPQLNVTIGEGDTKINPEEGKIYYFNKDTKINASVNDTTITKDNGQANIIINGIANDLKDIEYSNILEVENDKEKKYTISAYAKDYFDRTVLLEDFEVVIDKKVPAIIIEELSGTYNEEKTLVGSISDTYLETATMAITKNSKEEAKIELEIENGIAKINRVFEAGIYKVIIQGKDKSGNTAIDKELNFIIDTATPEISIYDTIKDLTNDEINGKYYTEDVLIDINIVDTTLKTKKVYISKDGGEYKERTDIKWSEEEMEEGRKASTTISISECGSYLLKVIGKGHSEDDKTESVINFIIDKDNPSLSIDGFEDIKENEDGYTYYKNKQTLILTVKDNNLNVNSEDVYIEPTLEIYKIENNKEIDVTKDIVGEENKWNFKENPETNIKDEITLKFNFDNKLEEGAYRIKLSYTDRAGLENIYETKKFIIDSTSPKIEYSGIKDYYNNNSNNLGETLVINIDELNFSNKNVVISAKKDGIDYSLNDNWIGTSVKNTFNEDGEYVITVAVSDKAGNKAKENLKFKFVIDSIKPQLSINGFKNGNADNSGYIHYKDTQNLKLIVKDNNLRVDANNNIDIESILKIYKIENSKVTDVTQNIVGQENKWKFIKTDATNINDELHLEFNIDNKLEEGTYEIQFMYIDSALNSSHIVSKFIVDSTKPLVSISGVEQNSFNSDAIDITLTVEEKNYISNNINITAIKDSRAYDIGNIKSESIVSELKHKFDKDGYYTIDINSTDKAGNIASKDKITFTIDTTKPNISITGIENEKHYNTNKTVNINIDDNNHKDNEITIMKSGEIYNVGKFNVSGRTASFNHTFSKEGDYEITIKSTDKANNQNSKVIKFTIDKTVPVITPKFLGESRVIKNGEYINKIFTPEFALDESEDKIVSVILNGTDNVVGRVPTSSKEAKYEYEVIARDKAGNETLLTIWYIVDITKPEIEITGILNGFFNNKLTPKYKISDENLDNSKTSVTLNDKTYNTGVTIDKEGYYTLKAVATDLANNVTTQTIIFTIDKTAPYISFDKAINGKYFTDVIIPELSIEDMTDYTIITQTLNGSPYNIGDEITQDGKYVLFLEVQDSAGNISNNTVEFIVDMTKPEFKINGADENSKHYNSLKLTVGLSYPTDKIKKMLLNGQLIEGEVIEKNGETLWEIAISDIGEHVLELVAVDDAGNETIKTFKFEIAEKTLLVKFFENKILLYSTIGLLIIGAIAIIVILFKKKQNHEENNSNEDK